MNGTDLYVMVGDMIFAGWVSNHPLNLPILMKKRDCLIMFAAGYPVSWREGDDHVSSGDIASARYFPDSIDLAQFIKTAKLSSGMYATANVSLQWYEIVLGSDCIVYDMDYDIVDYGWDGNYAIEMPNRIDGCKVIRLLPAHGEQRILMVSDTMQPPLTADSSPESETASELCYDTDWVSPPYHNNVDSYIDRSAEGGMSSMTLPPQILEWLQRPYLRD